MTTYSNIFEEIKMKVPLEDEVEATGANLISSGNGRMKCCCPLHKENTPSFFIYKGDEYNSFYCWGACKTGGDVIEFVKKYKNFSNYKETIEYFSKKYNLENSYQEKNLEEIFSSEIERRNRKGKLVYNYGFSSSRKIKDHILHSKNPIKEFEKISEYLKAIDLSIFEGNLDMLKFNREMVNDYIRKANDDSK